MNNEWKLINLKNRGLVEKLNLQRGVDITTPILIEGEGCTVISQKDLLRLETLYIQSVDTQQILQKTLKKLFEIEEDQHIDWDY